MNRLWEKFSIFDFGYKIDRRKQPQQIPMGFAQELLKDMKKYEDEVEALIPKEKKENYLKIKRKMRKFLRERIGYLVNYAERDVMTKLYKKEVFLVKADALLNNDSDFGIAVLDLNNLKYTNDTYGHKAGDHLIFSLVKAIRNLSEKYKVTACRAGGDEFYLLVPVENTSYEEKAKLIKKFNKDLRKEFAKIWSKKGYKDVDADFAVGWSLKSRTDDPTIEKLLHLADLRMYRNKVKIKLKNTNI